MIKNLLKIIIFIFLIIEFNLLYSLEAPKNLVINDIIKSEKTIEVDINDELLVHYDGWLFDKNIKTEEYCKAKGKKFDSTKEKPFRPVPTTFNFKIGKGLLIPGWELGLLKMREGSKRCLVIPHQLGYGHRKYNSIPPYSTLIFEIELLKINKNKQ